MDYQIFSITSEQALSFRRFMLPTVANSLQFPEYAFYLAVAEEGTKQIPLGILVADPKKYDPEILSIGVGKEYTRQGIGTALLRYGVEDLITLYRPEELEEPNHFLADFPVSEEREKAIAGVFEKAGFTLSGEGNFYEVTKQMLQQSEVLLQPSVKDKTEKFRKQERILSLKEVPKQKLKEFSYFLSEKEKLIPGILPELLDEDVSFLALDQEGNVTSCILFAKEDKGVLTNTFVYQSPRDDLSKSELIYLLAAAAGAVEEKFGEKVTLSFLTTGETSEKLLRKLFPEAKKDGAFLVYELDFDEAFRILGEERFHSDLAFDQFSLENMACRDCKHCQKNSTLECGKYLQKPDGVLNGGECPLFEN